MTTAAFPKNWTDSGESIQGCQRGEQPPIDGAKSPFEESMYGFCWVRDNPDILRLYLSVPTDSPVRKALRVCAGDLIQRRYTVRSIEGLPRDVALGMLVAALDELCGWYTAT